ncbi:MAG: type II secretion system F family protein [Actinomycetia bacterium]|nr:type II secretion system F family protein [Actinomycetes bacterium]
MTTTLRERLDRTGVGQADQGDRSRKASRVAPSTYRYEAFDSDHGIHRGQVAAIDHQDAVGQIRALGLRPLTVTIERPPLLSRELSLPGSTPKVKPRDLAVFSRQLASMLDAGIPVVSALDVLHGQTSNQVLAEAIGDVKHALRSGDSLSMALSRHPEVFDPVFAAMVGAGEASGSLGDVLSRLSFALERRVAIRSKIRSALGYPIAVLTLTGLIVVGMLLFVVPVFVSMYDDLDGQLPLATQLMVGISDILRGNPVIFAVVVIGLPVGFRRWKRTEGGARALDELVLRLPLVAGMVRRAAMARFARTLAVLTRAGVPILDALAMGAQVVGNRAYAEAIGRIGVQVTRGSTLAEPLADEPLFPELVGQLVSVGEQTGELDTMLDLMGNYYEDELDHTVDSLSSIMEPALMTILGITVGTIVLTLYLPMFRLIEYIQ